MINMNLLPKFHIISIKSFIFMLISLAIIILLHGQCKAILSERQDKMALLKKEIQTIDVELANSPQKNLAFAASQHKHPILLLALLKKLPYTMPIGLYLTELSMVKNSLKLIGYAENIELISAWANTLNVLHFTVAVEEMTQNKEVDDFAVKFCLRVGF